MMAYQILQGFLIPTQNRRTIRALQPFSPVPDAVIEKLAESAILNVPSAFNSQSTRMTILLKAEHRVLWEITKAALLAKLGHERFESGPRSTKDKVASYTNAYGTILFWDDVGVLKRMKEDSPEIYKDKAEEWVHQSNGMHQYYMWTALGTLGFGVNVQHYNPLIDEEIRKVWHLPSEWVLRAQMVFGAPAEGSEPGQKEQKLPLRKRIGVFGGDSA